MTAAAGALHPLPRRGRAAAAPPCRPRPPRRGIGTTPAGWEEAGAVQGGGAAKGPRLPLDRIADRAQGGDRGRNGRGARPPAGGPPFETGGRSGPERARSGAAGQRRAGEAGEQYAAPVLAPCIRPPAALSPAPPARASFQCDMIDI